MTQHGPVYLGQTANASGCIASLVDGRLASLANPIPELSSSLTALEVYTHHDALPPVSGNTPGPKAAAR